MYHLQSIVQITLIINRPDSVSTRLTFSNQLAELWLSVLRPVEIEMEVITSLRALFFFFFWMVEGKLI